jgi:hypothetical protein
MLKGARDLATAESSMTIGTGADDADDASHGAVDRKRVDANLICGALRTIKPAILRDNMVRTNNNKKRNEGVFRHIFWMARNQSVSTGAAIDCD